MCCWRRWFAALQAARRRTMPTSSPTDAPTGSRCWCTTAWGCGCARGWLCLAGPGRWRDDVEHGAVRLAGGWPAVATPEHVGTPADHDGMSRAFRRGFCKGRAGGLSMGECLSSPAREADTLAMLEASATPSPDLSPTGNSVLASRQLIERLQAEVKFERTRNEALQLRDRASEALALRLVGREPGYQHPGRAVRRHPDRHQA